MPALALGVVIGALFTACTLDTHGELAEGAPGKGGADASAPLDGGKGGWAPDASHGGSGGGGAKGGAAGAAVGGGGGVAGAAGSTGEGGAAGGTGQGGQAGTAGQGGQGGSPCQPNEKLCGTCVPLGNPLTGCIDGVCTPCSIPHGVADCSNGGDCGIAGCDYSYESCDGNIANGCETNVGTDNVHCGWCNHPCANPHGDAWCVSGACQLTCQVGWGDCDSNADNGCETDVTGDPGNCGACALACPKDTQCANSVCTGTCIAPMLECDGNLMNGCEVNPQFDVQNCGACGTVCHTGFNCNNFHCGCADNDANCNVSAPAGSFDCVPLSGADKCSCSGVLCDYGQYCNAQGACAW